MFDWADPAKWVAGIVNGLASLFVDFYLDLVTQIINLLFITAIPTIEELKSNFFTEGLGATFGLANQLMIIVTIAVALIVIMSPLRNHSVKLGRVVSSVAFISVFAVMFYPVYGLLYSIAQSLTQVVINLATSSSTGTIEQIIAALKVTMPGDPVSKLIAGFLTMFFGLFALIEAFGLRAILILLLWCYPLTIVLRPLNSFTRVLFNACNAGVVTVLAAPPLMALGFVLPVIVREHIPGGDLPFASAALAIVGGIFALVAPIVVAALVFQTSKEIFGRVDSSLSGTVDIGSMPPVSMDDVKQDVIETQTSPLKNAAQTMIAGKMLDDDLFGDMKKSDLAATVVTAAGHPLIGGAIRIGAQALDGFQTSNTQQAPQPQAPQSQAAPPPPPQSPPSPSAPGGVV